MSNEHPVGSIDSRGTFFSGLKKCFFTIGPVFTPPLFYAAIFFYFSTRGRTGNDHFFHYMASSPLFMSIDFLWWWPITIVLMTFAIVILFRQFLRWSLLYAILVASLWTLPIPLLFLWDYLHDDRSVPGLGISGVYWGWNFTRIGTVFIQENIIIFLFYVSCPLFILYFFAATGQEKIRNGSPWWILSLPITYLICLLPFIFTGAWVHGSIGSRVYDRCADQLSEIHLLLVRYAKDHDNRLPIADDFNTLLPQIQSYRNEESIKRRKLNCCIISEAMDRPPKPFWWNKSLSGKEIFYDGYYSRWLGEEPRYPGVPALCRGDERDTWSVVGSPWVSCPNYNPRQRGWLVNSKAIMIPQDGSKPTAFRDVYEFRKRTKEESKP